MVDSSGHQTPSNRAKAKGFAGFFNRLFGHNNGQTLRQSLEEVIEDHNGSGLQPEEQMLLTNVLSFGELRVDDIMIPRADIVAVDEDAGLDEVLKIMNVTAHSRMPIYRGTLDEPVGLLHIKDLLLALGSKIDKKNNSFPLSEIRREILFVPPSMPIADLLIRMQTSRIHMALVIDEYGGTDGLVTLEDLVEQIVGEIEDEHDLDEETLILETDKGLYDCSARALVVDFEELLGVDLLPDKEDDEIDTMGGFIFSLVKRVPRRGEILRHESGLEFEILDADPRRVKRLRIHCPEGWKFPRQAETAP